MSQILLKEIFDDAFGAGWDEDTVHGASLNALYDAITGGAILHSWLGELEAPADDHTQYAHLPGRAGGQTLYGGTGPGDNLSLQSTSHATLGHVDIGCGVRFCETDTAIATGSSIDFSPAATLLTGVGGVVHNVFNVAPVVDVESTVFVYSDFFANGKFNQKASTVFSSFIGVNAGPELYSEDASYNPLSSAMFRAAPETSARAAGDVGTVALVTGLLFSPSADSRLDGSDMTITNMTAVDCAPIYQTRHANAAFTVGTVRGLWCRNPAKALGGLDLGTETYTDYVGLDFNNVAKPVNTYVVRSALAAGANNWFLYNSGGAKSLFFDNTKIHFGTGSDAAIYYDGSDLIIDPHEVGTGDLVLAPNAVGNVTLFEDAANDETPLFKISGYRNLDALRVFSVGVGVDFADSVSMYLGARRVMLMNLVLRNYCYGEEAGLSLSTGDSNILIGNRAGRDLTTEDNNVIIGAYAGSEIIGPGNVIIGYQAGVGVNAVSTAQDNVFIGASAGFAITTGVNNAFIGYSAGLSTTAGSQNMFLGPLAGYYNVLGARNVFIGNQAGEGQSGLSTASDNVGLGWRSLQKYTTGDRNLALGTSALSKLTTGIRNTVAGHGAGAALTGGGYNSLFGYSAGNKLIGAGFNTLLGAFVGFNLTTGSDNIIIGYNIQASAIGVNDEFRLGNLNSNVVTLLWGDLANNRLGIGVVAAPTHNHEVAGTTAKGDVPGGDYTETEADGTVKFNGAATVWDDIQFDTDSGRVPAANAPTWEALTTNTSAYSFSVDDYKDLLCNEYSHAYQEGGTANMHAHVTLKTAQATGADRFVKLQVWLSYVNRENDTWSESTLSAELTVPTGSSALQAFYLDLGDVDLSGYLIGSQMKARIARIAATGGTEYADDVYITQVGAHLEKDTVGSRSEITK